jgi:hypothetical protein
MTQMPKRYEILNNSNREKINGNWIILNESDEFLGCWSISSPEPYWYFDFSDLVGPYRVVSPLKIDELLTTAQEKGYQVGFSSDPIGILDAYAHLKDTPPFSLNSTLSHTTNGFLPWQVVGFNKLIRDDIITAGYVVWDTGSGKCAHMAASIRWHMQFGHPFDLALVVVKAHNKADTQGKLKSLGDIDSIIIDGTADQRWKAYEWIETEILHGRRVVAITNYEKLRDDAPAFQHLLRRRDVLCYWDEMPTKLSNPETQLYRAVKKDLYTRFPTKPRTSWARHWILTATPVENSPDDVFYCVNLVRPGLLGSESDFHADHVISYNFFNDKPERWRGLDKIEAKLSHMTHRVSKKDPEVAKMFPEVIYDPIMIDWNPKHRAVYDKLTKKAGKIVEESLKDLNILSMIQVMQMMCDAPSMIRMSASKREDFLALLSAAADAGDLSPGFLAQLTPEGSDAALRLLSVIDVNALTDIGHTKLETWLDIIQVKHPDSKIVTHSTWANYIWPIWIEALDRVGVSYVIYNGTTKQKQKALDNFRQDPDIRVFLSGDSGSDSIDIPQANVGINYNGPWKSTTMKQREGRRDRVNSTFETIYTYDLMMAASTDLYKKQIRDRKQAYHDALFEGAVSEESISASLTKADLRYLLLGDEIET